MKVINHKNEISKNSKKFKDADAFFAHFDKVMQPIRKRHALKKPIPIEKMSMFA
jgi:hypothetical protein